jgi:phosphonate transport system substrate-binding protein
MYSTKKTLQRLAALTAALTAVVAISSGSGVQAKIEVKVGDKCTKAQYGKTQQIGAVGVRCTYKNKKYSWTKVATTTATTIPVKVDKSQWPKKFVIGAVPSENAAAMTLKYQGLVKLFQDELGIPVEFYSATDYAGIIEAQIANKVDLAFYGPFSYVIAKLNGAKIEPAGVAVSSATGVPGYRSYGIAKANNTAVTKIADFKGKRICFVDPASTSGALYPTAGLLAAGIDPAKETTQYAGGHPQSVQAVNAGTCDVGFAYDDILDVNVPAGKVSGVGASDIKVVWKSGLIAGSPIAVRLNMPQSLVDAVRNIVLDKANKTAMVKDGRCTTEATCQIIEDSSWGFVKTTDSYYDGVRAVCESTKSTKCR